MVWCVWFIYTSLKYIKYRIQRPKSIMDAVVVPANSLPWWKRRRAGSRYSTCIQPLVRVFGFLLQWQYVQRCCERTKDGCFSMRTINDMLPASRYSTKWSLVLSWPTAGEIMYEVVHRLPPYTIGKVDETSMEFCEHTPDVLFPRQHESSL